jgi:protein-S-isoprenylcysteine O-methyltransferase Ste14
MPNQHKRDDWLQDIQARQRNIVFPDTVENETRFWRNLGTGPSKTSTKIGLAVLAIFVFGFAAAILVATHQAGVTWLFVLAMLLLCGPIFGAIAWATRKSLRDIEKARRDPKLRKR